MGGSKVKGKDLILESSGGRSGPSLTAPPPKFPKKVYEAELLRLQEELVKMAEWVNTYVPDHAASVLRAADPS